MTLYTDLHVSYDIQKLSRVWFGPITFLLCSSHHNVMGYSLSALKKTEVMTLPAVTYSLETVDISPYVTFLFVHGRKLPEGKMNYLSLKKRSVHYLLFYLPYNDY